MAVKQQTSEKMWQRKSMHIRFNDDDMDFNFLVPLAFGTERGSTIGECFYIASRIKEGDPVSWANEWTHYANTLQAQAELAEKHGHSVSAGEQYLRAFTYNRTGIMALRPSQPESRTTYESMRHCFEKAIETLGLTIEPVDIPYQDTTLPGYFMQGVGNAPRPTLITTHGGEMFAEELYFWVGAAAMRRGYNVLSVNTPGGPVLRLTQPQQHVRPFFLNGVRTLVDYALSRAETDPQRLAVMGFSGGGNIAMRLAAQDKRVCALVASAPIYDLYALASAEFPVVLQKAPSFVGDMLMRVATSVSPWTKVALERVLWASGVTKLSELLDLMKEGGSVDVSAIGCPTLCLTGEGESKNQNVQAQYVYDHLPNPRKAFHLFTVRQGADAHCQNNNFSALQQITFDWLDSVFS